MKFRLRIASAIACALGTVAASAPRVAAQVQEQRTKGYLELSALQSTFTGDNLATPVDPGYGFDLGVTISPMDRFLLGGGVHYSRHFTSDTTGKLGVLQFAVEPRVAILTTGKVRPWVGLRFGFIRTSQELVLYDDIGLDVRGQAVQGGQTIGASAGVVYMASYNVRAFGSVTYQALKLGDMSFDEQVIPGSSSDARMRIVRVGVSIDFSLPDAAQMRRTR